MEYLYRNIKSYIRSYYKPYKNVHTLHSCIVYLFHSEYELYGNWSWQRITTFVHFGTFMTYLFIFYNLSSQTCSSVQVHHKQLILLDSSCSYLENHILYL